MEMSGVIMKDPEILGGDASVNLIWPLLIFSFGPTLW